MKGIKIFALCILVLLFAGCQTKDEKEAVQSVRLYNDKMVLAMQRPEPELMKNLVTDKEYERVLMYILYLYQNNAILDAKLDQFDIVNVDIKGSKATVKTNEVWHYKRIDKDSRKTIQPEKKVSYQGTYSLEKNKQNKLVVSKLEVRDNTDKERNNSGKVK